LKKGSTKKNWQEKESVPQSRGEVLKEREHERKGNAGREMGKWWSACEKKKKRSREELWSLQQRRKKVESRKGKNREKPGTTRRGDLAGRKKTGLWRKSRVDETHGKRVRRTRCRHGDASRQKKAPLTRPRVTEGATTGG